MLFDYIKSKICSVAGETEESTKSFPLSREVSIIFKVI